MVMKMSQSVSDPSCSVEVKPAGEELCESISGKFTRSSANYTTSSYVCPDQMQKKKKNH